MRGFVKPLAAAIALSLATFAAPASPLVLADLTAGGAGQAAVLAARMAADLPRRASGDFRAPSPGGWTARFERDCLALAVYHEARGEHVSGQFAVARVIVNRAHSRAYPMSVCGVVYQNARRRNRCQFSFACDTISEIPRDRTSWDRAVRIAGVMLCRADCAALVDDPAGIMTMRFNQATHYHATYVSPSWARKLEPLGRIGDHVFFASKRVLRRL